jgi:putative flippase GtrA
VSPRSAFRSQPVRFALVGVGAAALMFALSYLLALAGMRPFLGTTLAYAVAFAFAYTAQRAWTFGARHKHGHAFPRYCAIQAVCALLSGVLAHLLVASLSTPPLVMSAVTTVAASLASYFLSSRWAFAAAAASGRHG